MLEVQALRKSWTGFSLSVSLSLEGGAIGAVLGPSGCGKSSLLRLVAGLDKQDSGSVLLDGQRIEGLRPESRRIGFVFQDFALFPNMSVRRNIEYAPRVARMAAPARNAIVEGLADSFGIGPLLERAIPGLSGGEKQRVALARTMAGAPRLVLLDEPFSSLDPGLRKRTRLETAQRLRESGTTALFVTHDVEEALGIADRVFLMRQGSMVEDGAPEAIYTNPRFAWSARFLGRGPVIPILSVTGGTDAPILRTSFGPFSGLASAATPVAGDAIHFAASAPRLVPASANGRRGSHNLLAGRVVDSSFAGSHRVIILDHEDRAGTSPSLLELAVPPSTHIARGDLVAFSVDPAHCVLLVDG